VTINFKVLKYIKINFKLSKQYIFNVTKKNNTKYST